jgi:chromosome segregation ATPase
MVFQIAGAFARSNHLRATLSSWLTVTQKLELAVSAVDEPLVNAVQRIEALSAELRPILDKLKNIQLSLNEPASLQPKFMESQAWNVALRTQAELEKDVNLIREKLLDIHLQFCRGQAHENLVYDLTSITDAVQTVSNTAQDLERSITSLRDNLQQVETAGLALTEKTGSQNIVPEQAKVDLVSVAQALNQLADQIKQNDGPSNGHTF